MKSRSEVTERRVHRFGVRWRVFAAVSTLAVAGVAADALAVVIIHAGSMCYICLTGTPQSCLPSNADHSITCNEGEIAQCAWVGGQPSMCCKSGVGLCDE